MNLSKNSLLFFSSLIVSILAVYLLYFLSVFIYSPFYLDGQGKGTVDFLSFLPPAAESVRTAPLSLSFIAAHLPRFQLPVFAFLYLKTLATGSRLCLPGLLPEMLEKM